MPSIQKVKVGETTEYPDVCVISSGPLVELRHSTQTGWLEAVQDFEAMLTRDPGLIAHFHKPGEPGRILNLVIPGGILCACMAVMTEQGQTVGGYVLADGEWKEPLWFHGFNRLCTLAMVLNVKNTQFIQAIFDTQEDRRAPLPAPPRPADSTVH